MKSRFFSPQSLATFARQAITVSRRFRPYFFLLLGAAVALLLVVALVRQRPPVTHASPAPATRAQGSRITGSGQSNTISLTQTARTAKEEKLDAPPATTPTRSEHGPNPSYILPGNAPAAPSNDPPTRPGGGPQTPLAPTDFVVTNIHDLSTAETSTQLENNHEPSVGNLDGTIFYTANTYAARSSDGGQSFTYTNPATTFANLNGGFCCDQIVNHAPAQNMMLWLLQYNTNGTNNSLRLAYAIGNQVAANAWASFVFTPQSFGVGAGHELDFPTMTLGANFVYVTANIHNSTSGALVRSIVMRISLAQLAVGNLDARYFAGDGLFSPRCVEGANTTMYWAVLTSNSQIRIHRWDEASNDVFWDDVTVNGFVQLTQGSGVATSPDGTNWAGRAQTKILGAYRRNGVLGFMWPAKQNAPARPYPYTIVAEFNEATRGFISQADIWSDVVAWLYPNVSVNAAGNLGGVINFGGGSYYPGTAGFMTDDVTPIIVPLPNVAFAFSNTGPLNNRWGDYITVRRHKTIANTYVTGFFYLDLQGATRTIKPRFLRFGRERDFPACGYSISPTIQPVPAVSGSGIVSVTSVAGCNWTATSNNPTWLTITGGASGSGNGTVFYSVAANPGIQRTGTLTIAGQTFTVSQAGTACVYAFNTPAQAFTNGGGANSFSVTTASGCFWTADPDVPWITITAGGSGNGFGTVSYTVAINNNASPRTGRITVGTNTFLVHQAGPNTLLEENFNSGIPSTWTVVDGGSGGLNGAQTWTTANPCGRTTMTAPFSSPFAMVDSDCAGVGPIQDEGLITPPFNASGMNRVLVEFTNQFRYFTGSLNEFGDIDVSTNGGATWTTIGRFQGADFDYPTPGGRFVDITSAIAPNPSNVRVRFRYYNASFEYWWAIDNVRIYDGCGLTLSPASQFVSASGITTSLTVSAVGGCPWTAVSSQPSWLILNNSSGTGSGALSYTVTANSSASTPRTGTITVGGRVFVVTQAATGVLLAADFNTGLPPGWSVVDGGNNLTSGAAASWTATNPGRRIISPPFASNFMIIDSDKAGISPTQDDQLISPVFSTAGFGQAVLEFNSQFVRYIFGLNEVGDVDVSTDGGLSWNPTPLLRLQNSDDGYPVPRTYALPLPGNAANVRVRFHYYNANWEWWWAIDNVKVRCPVTISPTSQGFGVSGGTNNIIGVTATCAWTATISDPTSTTWLTITSPAGGNGTGNTPIFYNVAANVSATPRIGVISVNNQSFIVTQTATGLLFSTDFSSGIPPGWEVIKKNNPNPSLNNNGPNSTWTPTNHCLRPISGFGPNFVIMDVGYNCPVNAEIVTPDEMLISPPLNATGLNNVMMDFKTRFHLRQTLPPGVTLTGDVDVSSNGGASWINVFRQTSNEDFASLKSTNLTPYLSANMKVRFHYYATGGQLGPAGKQLGRPDDIESSNEYAMENTKACGYSLGSGSQSFGSAGGSGSVVLTTGGSCGWTLAGAPFWITPAATSGAGAGPVNFTVAFNPSSTARSATLTIGGVPFVVTQSGACPSITLMPATLPGGTVGTFYNQTFSASGGAGPYNFNLISGALPLGLGLSGSGNSLLSGIPSQSGTFNFTIRATDQSACTGTQAYILNIAPGNPCTTPTLITIGQTVTGTLSTGDCTLSDGSFADLYRFSATAGQQIAVSLTATQFDAFLYLIAPSGNQLAFDDDGGGGTNARIPPGSGVITLPATGNYTIYANSFSAGETGSYTLTLTGGGVSNGLQFYPLAAPVRLLDTRGNGVSPNACTVNGSQPIAANTSLLQMARGICGLPASAVALTGNITTVQSGGGYLTLYPSDATRPTVASTNYGPNEVVNNVFTVGLGAADGKFNIYALTTTHVTIDVTGYYAPPTANGLYFHALPAPVRLLETRPGEPVGCVKPGLPLVGGTDALQTATTACTGIPAAARSVVGNATTVSPAGVGYLTLYPADVATAPLVASSNYSTNQIVNGPFTVGLSPAGQFKIFTTQTTHLVVDVLGYYSPEAVDANGTGLLFTPLAHPVRLLETRAGQPVGCFKPNAPLNGLQVYTQAARGLCDGLTIPTAALGVVGNATVVFPQGGGYLTLWPSTAAQPTVATANYDAGAVVNRHFIVGLGQTDGAFKQFSLVTTDLVIDLAGYFAP